MKDTRCLVLLFAIAAMTAVSFSSNGAPTAKADQFGSVEMVCQDMSYDYLLQADLDHIQYLLCAVTYNLEKQTNPVIELAEAEKPYIDYGCPEKEALFWYSLKNEILKNKFLITDYLSGKRLISG